MTKTMSCQVHDHFEHVCVLALPVNLHLKTGDGVAGRVVDLGVENGEDWILLEAESGRQRFMVSQIRRLEYVQGSENRTVLVE